MDRIAPTHRPSDRPTGFQRWRHLLFLHWQVSETALRPLLPPELEIDTFDGRAYIGVVPFTMRDVTPWFSPSIPFISNFHELNVRTYVHFKGSIPGVWFFSLDAANSIAVLAARSGWGLPYHKAKMELTIQDDLVHYSTRRKWPGPKPAELQTTYRIGDSIDYAEPGTFEHFLVERYILFVKSDKGLKMGQVHHRPYPIHRADVIDLNQTMVQATGLPSPEGPPHVLYSPGVDVDIYRLNRLET